MPMKMFRTTASTECEEWLLQSSIFRRVRSFVGICETLMILLKNFYSSDRKTFFRKNKRTPSTESQDCRIVKLWNGNDTMQQYSRSKENKRTLLESWNYRIMKLRNRDDATQWHWRWDGKIPKFKKHNKKHSTFHADHPASRPEPTSFDPHARVRRRANS